MMAEFWINGPGPSSLPEGVGKSRDDDDEFCDCRMSNAADRRMEAFHAAAALRGGELNSQPIFHDEEISQILSDAERIYRWVVSGGI